MLHPRLTAVGWFVLGGLVATFVFVYSVGPSKPAPPQPAPARVPGDDEVAEEHAPAKPAAPQPPPAPRPAFRAPAVHTAPAGSRVGVWRPRLVVGDPDRNWAVLWSRAAAAGEGPHLGRPASLTPADGGPAVTIPAEPAPAAEPVQHAQQTLRLPADLRPGRYALAINGLDCGAVEVVPARARPQVKQLKPGDDADELERALRDHDVELLPGRYVFSRAVHLPAGRRITGWGAHIFRTPDGDYGERMFVGGADCTLTGLTLHPWYLAFHSNPAVQGLVLDRVTLASGILGYGYDAALVRDCVFDGGYNPAAPSGLYLRCRFVGGAPTSALRFDGQYPGNTAVIDCTFERTRDALVVNTNHGSFTDNLIHNLRAYGIVGGANGNEVCSAEGDAANECSRNLYWMPRVLGCNSPLFWTSTTRRDEFVYALEADGPSSIVLSGWGGAEISGCRFVSYELRGGRLIIGQRDAAGNLVSGKVVRNSLQGWHVGPLVSSRMNQPIGQAWQYAPANAVCAFDADEAAANDLTGVVGVGASVAVTVWRASDR
jgi:hypothetical protein